MRHVLAVIGAGAALAVAGCGGDDEEQQPAGGGGTATEETTPDPAGAGTSAQPNGKQLFTVTCGGCHTLRDAGTSGQVGPNLDDLKPDAKRVRNAIATGPGTMPENLLEGGDADAVAKYVAQAAGG